MSIIETLTEGIVNRDMKKEGTALLNKWNKTGLLEGLQSEHQKSTMARLLENQAKELLREANTMTSGDVEGFAAVAFPIVRRVFAGLIANDLVSVQPMSLPSGLIFFLDFTFGANIGASSSATDRLGNAVDASIYGTNRVASQVTGGVDLVGTNKEGFSGPGRDGQVGYAYASATKDVTVLQANFDLQAIDLDSATEAQKKLLKFDADLLALSGSSTSQAVAVFAIAAAGLSSENPDFENCSPMLLNDDSLTDQTGIGASVTAAGSLVRRLTRRASAADAATGLVTEGELLFFASAPSGSGATQIDPGSLAEAANITASIVQRDDVGTSSNVRGAIAGYTYPLEAETDIPEIDIKVDSIAITAQTKKLKAKWTPELGQDLNAYHNLDAEVELTSILSEQIALEIDREILADLVNGATAGTFYWSRSPGLFVNRETGAEIGASAAAPDFTGTVSEWYETLIETINDVSAQIHRKTLRGGANFVIVSPEVANVLEFTSGFRANVTADADKGDIGAVKVGSLSRKFDVIVDPYFPRNVILVGRKGNSFLESGYVYAPYVPLQTTPTIFGPEDFVPRKGVMTRYAKKMVRPDMYGLVIVRGLLKTIYNTNLRRFL
jgi:hypothetical protein